MFWLGLLIFSFHPLYASFSDEQAETIQRLETIPAEDQAILRNFFKDLLTDGDFAATLFGYKPSALLIYPFYTDVIANPLASQKTFLKLRHRFSAKFLLEYKGWQLWEKYQSLFPVKHYFLEHKFLPGGSGYSVLFVHKEKMLSTLAEHADYFRFILAEKNPLDNAINILRTAFSGNLLKIMHCEAGILLGYDPQSCFDFQQKFQIEETLYYFPYDVQDVSHLPQTQTQLLLDGYPNDLFSMHKKFKEEFLFRSSWQTENPFFCSTPFGFCSFSTFYDPQIPELQNKIINLYNSNSFLIEFLTLLSE